MIEFTSSDRTLSVLKLRDAERRLKNKQVGTWFCIQWELVQRGYYHYFLEKTNEGFTQHHIILDKNEEPYEIDYYINKNDKLIRLYEV